MKILRYFITSAILYCCLLFCAIQVVAQSESGTEITGKITTVNNEALPFASLMLFNVLDSTLVKGAVTDDSGAFIIGNIMSGNYYISARVLGYKTYKSENFKLAPGEKKALGSILLTTENKELKAIIITAKKPLIENKIDKVVMNIANSILATGNSAIDILQKAPGVTVNNNGVISLIGKNNVLVLINNKQTYLSPEQMKDYLNSLQSNTIESIELITNPPAQYDASGNAGIINIKMKHNDAFGTNADVNFSYGQGIYRKMNGGVTMNRRSKVLNIFANYNHSNNDDYSLIDVNRSTTFSKSTFLTSSSLEEFRYKTHSFKVGSDFNLSSKSVLGFIVDGYFWHADSKMEGTTKMGSQYGKVDSTILGSTMGSFPANYFNYDINYKLQLDTVGTELTFSGNYSTSSRKEVFNFSNQFLDENQNGYRSDYDFRNLAPQRIDIYVGKGDFTHPFSKSSKLHAGFKYSSITINNVLKYDILQNDNTYLNDERRSNQFIYHEKIGAAYVNYSTRIGSYSIQSGIRVERTTSESDLVRSRSIGKKIYTNLFPTLFVLKKIDDANAITASYGRRVGRPNYSSLNPFFYYIDQYTFRVGNPFLKPQYTNSYNIGYRFKSKYAFDLNYSKTKDAIAVIFLSDAKTKSISKTDANLNRIDTYSANINVPITVVDRWRSYNNVSIYYNRYKSSVIEQTSLQLEKLAWQASTNHTFTINSHSSLELSAKYVSPNVYGIFNLKSYYGVDLGMKQTLLNSKASIKLLIIDIFKTVGKRSSFSNLPNNNYIIDTNNDSRFARLSLSYKFGKVKLKSTDKKGSAEEERNRLN